VSTRKRLFRLRSSDVFSTSTLGVCVCVCVCGGGGGGTEREKIPHSYLCMCSIEIIYIKTANISYYLHVFGPVAQSV